MISNTRAKELLKLSEAGGPLDYSPDIVRLLIRVVRTLARGRPVSGEQVDHLVAEAGISREEAAGFLRRVSERNTHDDIVGLVGLSLNDHPHRFTVDGVRMSTWCALDTLFLPAMLRRAARIESASPLSGQMIRLTVDPQGVLESDPPGAALSIVVVDPDTADMGSVEAIWMAFCQHVHFFTSRDEAERWAAGRDDVEILSVDEGYRLGMQLWAKVLAAAG